jgi:hypothetical protein
MTRCEDAMLASFGSHSRTFSSLYYSHICEPVYNTSTRRLINVNGVGFNITSIVSQRGTTYAAQYTTTSSPPGGNARIMIWSSATTIPTLSSSPSPTASSPPRHSGLSTSGTASIAVGVVASVGALVALRFMVWRNKRKVDQLQSRIPDDNVDH